MTAAVKVGKNTLWLVKANGCVIGPYLDKQVSDLLRERALVPLDEVSRPCGRWLYVKDEPAFAKVIEEVRIRNMRGGDDSVTRSAGSDATDTISLTEPDERTQEITSLPSDAVQDVMFQSLDDKTSNTRAGNAFVFDADRAVKEQAQKNARWIWVFTTVVVLLCIGVVVFEQFIAKPIQNRSALDQSTSQGVDALERGDYSHALELFNRAYALDPSDSGLYLYLGILKVQVENQPFQGRQMLEKLRGREDREQKHVLTAIGLSFLKEGDSKQAEDNFQKALDADPLFQPAVINLGAAALYQNDWAKANNHLQLAAKDTHHDGIEFLMLAEALSKIFEADKDAKKLDDGVREITEFANHSLDYQLEARVALVYLQSLLGDRAKTAAMLDAILDSDLMLTEDHRHNLFVHRDRMNWASLAKWCAAATQGIDASPHLSTFEAMCLAKSGQFADANRRIDDALAQAPKDPLALAMSGYILSEMNLQDQAKVAIDHAIENDPKGQWAQPHRLMARHCHQRADRECERKNWQAVLAKSPQEIAALAGLAKLALDEKNNGDAKKYLVQGLGVSDHYLPLFPINRAITQADDREKDRGL